MSEGVTVGEGVSKNLGVGIWGRGKPSRRGGRRGPEACTLGLYPITYTLTVRNESQSRTDFAVYQTDPRLSTTVAPLVWQDAPLSASAETALSWNPSYSFSWSPSPDLKFGETYRPTRRCPSRPANTRGRHRCHGYPRCPCHASDEPPRAIDRHADAGGARRDPEGGTRAWHWVWRVDPLPH